MSVQGVSPAFLQENTGSGRRCSAPAPRNHRHSAPDVRSSDVEVLLARATDDPVRVGTGSSGEITPPRGVPATGRVRRLPPRPSSSSTGDLSHMRIRPIRFHLRCGLELRFPRLRYSGSPRITLVGYTSNEQLRGRYLTTGKKGQASSWRSVKNPVTKKQLSTGILMPTTQT